MKFFRFKSIRGQLTFGLLAALGPCLAVGFLATQELARSRIYSLTERRLQAEGQLISYGLEQWGLGIRNLAEILAETPAFVEGDLREVGSVFRSLNRENPDRLWRLWSASNQPKILAFSGTISPQQKAAAEASQSQRDYFQAALRGYATYQVVMSRTTGRACLNVSQPVFANNQLLQNHQHARRFSVPTPELLLQPLDPNVKSVIVLCLPLNHLGQDTGLTRLFDNDRLKLLSSDNQRDFLADPKGFDSAVMLVSNSGQLLFPDIDWESSKIPSISELVNSTVPGLFPVAQRAMSGDEIFTVIRGKKHDYFALTARVDSAWSLVLLLNETSATRDVADIRNLVGLVGLITIALLIIIVTQRSRSLSRPLSTAGDALTQISQGNFDLALPPASDDEIGGLISNIQLTANRLKCYVQGELAYAVTEKQLETAKSIQRDFLLPYLPVSPNYDVKAFSRPALQIGADWYDMVDTGDHAIFIVADVCDKGVPSALYMSVFRSLIRSKILDGFSSEQPALDASGVIRNAIEQTNNYMASNQNSSMMFATVFIAAVHKTTGLVSCICAGHESPVLVTNGQQRMLDSVSGPAIGLFEGASYPPFTVNLAKDDTLVVYSDGLVDARNPANEGWGIDGLHELLTNTPIETAEQLMDAIITRVDAHMSGEDQFDDLTVMVFRWLGA